MDIPFILKTDSYKCGHSRQYLDGTQGICSYYESRKGSTYPYTVFYGLQAVIKQHLLGTVVTKEQVDFAEKMLGKHLGPGVFERSKWDYIVEKHKGKIPVRIRAVREGSVIPVDNALMVVENTDENCAFVTNFIETLLTHIWYTSAVATRSRHTKEIILGWLKKTCNDSVIPDVIPFMLHDFGARGVETMEAAALGGSAHILNFLGTDTVPSLVIPHLYYNEAEDFCPAYSVRATEHSVMTARGEEGEWEVVEHLLDTNGEGILAMVIDSFDYRRFIETMGTKYKDRVMSRNGRIVFRPDSGDPKKVSLDVIELLGKHFGSTVNEKGYKVLPLQVRCLWGDGITDAGIDDILRISAEHGWSSENWIFGMGGGLLQKINRDTQRSAFKCCAQKYDNVWHDVYKKPIDLSKASKRGRLALVLRDGQYSTIREEELQEGEKDLLEVVFENGELLREQTFTEVRKNAAVPIL